MDVFVDENVHECIGMYGPYLKESLKQEMRKNAADNQLWISKRMGRPQSPNSLAHQPQFYDFVSAPTQKEGYNVVP